MRLFITVIIMEILAGAEVDLFVPSFPDIQDTFNLSAPRSVDKLAVERTVLEVLT